jgi:hypothetical protein
MSDTTTKKDLEAQAAAAMAELDAMADMTPPAMPPSQMAVLLGQAHAELTRQFWAQRNAGEVCTIVGDHAEAKEHFVRAKGTLMRLRALGTLAETRGVRAAFEELVAAYEAQERPAPRQPAR